MSSYKFSKLVALRYLWTKRSEAFISIITLISILGVAIGVMVLNIVMSVMTGFEHELREKIVGTDSHVTVSRLGGRLTAWQETVSAISQVPGIKSVSPFTYHQALLRSQGSSSGLLIRGITPDTDAAAQLDRFMEAPQTAAQLFSPTKISDSDQPESDALLPGIVIGKELARSMSLYVGSPVSILAPNVASTPFGLLPKYRRFVVVGTYSSGLVEYERGLAYVSLSAAQEFFRLGDAVSGLEIRVVDVDQAPLVAKAIIEKLGGIGSGYIAEDWTVKNKPLWDAIRLEKKVYFVVLLLIVVMASFSIITSLVMIVLEKRKDIAILKTLGASNKSIADIFRFQGAVIGALGTIAGLVLGYLGCVLLREYGFPIDQRIFQMSKLPIRIEPLNFFIVGLSAFIICFLATLYPARRATKLEPAEILRYE